MLSQCHRSRTCRFSGREQLGRLGSEKHPSFGFCPELGDLRLSPTVSPKSPPSTEKKDMLYCGYILVLVIPGPVDDDGSVAGRHL